MDIVNNFPLSRSGRNPLEVATQAVKEAGEVLVKHFYSQKTITRKGRGNLVTDVDTLSEKIILDLLKNEYPEHNVLSEESNSFTTVTGYTWIVDPIDGTNNYVFGIPYFCVNVALVNNNDIVLGLTFDPVKKELFYAEKGKGAYLNGSSIHVSNVNLLKDSLLGFDLGYDDNHGKKMLEITSKLRDKVHCLRLIGSPALGLAYVACGRITIYFQGNLYPWDIASGLLLIREAGGMVVSWQGNQADFKDAKIIASNSLLYPQLAGYFG